MTSGRGRISWNSVSASTLAATATTTTTKGEGLEEVDEGAEAAAPNHLTPPSAPVLPAHLEAWRHRRHRTAAALQASGTSTTSSTSFSREELGKDGDAVEEAEWRRRR